MTDKDETILAIHVPRDGHGCSIGEKYWGCNEEQIVRNCAFHAMRELRSTNIQIKLSPENWERLFFALDERKATDLLFEYVDNLGTLSICVGGRRVICIPDALIDRNYVIATVRHPTSKERHG